MRLLLVLTIVLLSNFAHAASQTDLQANQILSDIERRGASVVVKELYDDPEVWDELLRNVSSGNLGWLKVAEKLGPGTDAGSTNMLEIAIFRALGNAPVQTLTLLSRGDRTIPCFRVEFVCSSDFLIDDPADQKALNLIDRTISRLQEIKEPSLITTRNTCIEGLQQARRDTLRLMREAK